MILGNEFPIVSRSKDSKTQAKKATQIVWSPSSIVPGLQEEGDADLMVTASNWMKPCITTLVQSCTSGCFRDAETKVILPQNKTKAKCKV